MYKIHPAIGIVRVGDAPTFFIGPETPGLRPTGELPGTKVPPYKDGGRIKPQAARFRIFEYVVRNGRYEVSRELSLADKDVTKLVWTVHLANRKASFFNFEGLVGTERPHPRGNRRNDSVLNRRSLEIDPRPRSITANRATPPAPVEFRKGKSANPASELWPTPAPAPAIETLGTLMTDADGRLIVLGGKGIAARQPGSSDIDNYANNDGWFDDVSDGPVTAQLQVKGKSVKVEPAWVLCGPPDFAPHIHNVVSLYDLLFDVAARHLALPANWAKYRSGGALAGLAAINAEFRAAGKPELTSYKPDFASEVYPLLAAVAAVSFVFAPAVGKHTALVNWADVASPDPKHLATRQALFTFVRSPDTPSTDSFPYMPKLLGDEPAPLPLGIVHPRVRLTVTPTQYAVLKQWAAGKFVPPAHAPPLPPSAPAITPDGLDRAALEACVGGAFFPGIEVGWQIRDEKLFAEPFRIKPAARSNYMGDPATQIKAGHFSRQMALPWQADFLECKSEHDQTSVFPGMDPWGWWPAQRPDGVFASEADYTSMPRKPPVQWHRSTANRATKPWVTGFRGVDTTIPSYQEMLDNWRKFGFVLEVKPNVYVEQDRAPDVP